VSAARIRLLSEIGIHDDCGAYCAHDAALRDSLVRDMRGRPVGDLTEAREGYIADGLPGPDGRRHVVASGSRLQIRAFLRSWAPAQGLTDLYGDPERGFAGGYMP
jgi:hypothetical protein